MVENTTCARRSDGGFTLIELLMVIVITGILITIALPSYLKFKTRANDKAAQTAMHNVGPSLVQFAGTHTDGYRTVNTTYLRQSYGANVKNISIFNATTTTYCLKSKVATQV